MCLEEDGLKNSNNIMCMHGDLQNRMWIQIAS